jgi:hypothetical protein
MGTDTQWTTCVFVSGWFWTVTFAIEFDGASNLTVSPSEARLGLQLAPLTPLVGCSTGGGGICGGGQLCGQQIR